MIVCYQQITVNTDYHYDYLCQSVRKEMVRWMCGVKLKDRLPSKELRERLGVDDIALVLQQNRLRWYGHVLRKETMTG